MKFDNSFSVLPTDVFLILPPKTGRQEEQEDWLGLSLMRDATDNY
jgi:hypothetical protein